MSNLRKCPNCGSPEVIIKDEKKGQYQCHACLSLFIPNENRSPDLSMISQPKSKSFFDKMMGKVVELNVYFEKDVIAGSGFFISPEYILTNAHVVMSEQRRLGTEMEIAISITGNDYSKKNKYQFDIVTADLKLDIAVLKVQKGKYEYISFAQNIYNGEPVYAIGNSQGEGLCITEGIVSDASRHIEEREFFMTSALATKGNSGCPVFNTNGQLLGMITEGSKTSISMIYAIPFNVLLNYVKTAEDKENIKIL